MGLDQAKTDFIECEKELRATIDRLQIQLEESQRNQNNGRPMLELEAERLKFENEELKKENSMLKKAGDSFTSAMQQVTSLKNELKQTQERLSKLHSDYHTIKNEPSNNERELISTLKENIQKEKAERMRIEKDNLRLIERIRLMNTRRSISEAESQIDFDALKKVTMSGLFRTAFVNGSKAKKLISFYILFIHVLLVYKLIF